MQGISRRNFLGLGALGQTITSSVLKTFQVTEDKEVIEGPEKKPELYWEILRRCPNGHLERKYVLRESFDEDEARKEPPYSTYCWDCHDDWLERNFPPNEYLMFQPVDMKELKKRNGFVVY